jgi:hypothetical protein
MTSLETLLELVARVGASNGAGVTVNEQELSQWPITAVRELKEKKLLVEASPATSAVCPGCEQECTMPIHIIPGTRPVRSFVVCDKRDDINRVNVPAERLQQWRCDAEAVGVFVAQSLGIRAEGLRKIWDGLWQIGLIRGKKRSQMLCLKANGSLELLAGSNAIPLSALLQFETKGYAIDATAVRQLADMASTGDSRYTPSKVRQEARKLSTQNLYENWRKAYRQLKTRRPRMSDKWYSQQIAKSPSAAGRSAETIRKHMKP